MRIAMLSDLTFSEDRERTLQDIIERVSKLSPDVLVLAGNLGESFDQFDRILGLFDRLTCPKAAILGNQDLWNRTGDLPSERLWEEVLPTTLRENQYVYLETDNLVLDGVGICGTIGWYDYSSRDPSLKYTVDQYQELKGLVNFDAQYIDWIWTDQDFAARVQADFTRRLDELEHARHVDHVIVVTHMPVFGEAISHHPSDARWNFGTAYAFNLSLGRVIAPRMKVRHVVSGHVHTGGAWTITFGQNVFNMQVMGWDAGEPNPIIVEI